MRVLITGATGLIGSDIVKVCHLQGIAVNYLTTQQSKIVETEHYKGFYWNPNKGDIDKTCFEDVEVIIHLAGATISKRWTPEYKDVIISSRVKSTQLLIDTLKGESHSVKQIISGSAIGIYPDSLVNYYEEHFKETNSMFLGKVTKAWEKAVDGFSVVNVKVTKIRTGLVLSNIGGALPEMMKPIKFGFGSALGHGKQWQSWIHINDLSHMFMHVLNHSLYGVYNGVAPNPVSNKELTKTLAKVLKRPLFLPNIPKFIMKFILGDMHALLFDSQRVSSKKIEDSGFVFEYHYLKPALEDLLGRC